MPRKPSQPKTTRASSSGKKTTNKSHPQYSVMIDQALVASRKGAHGLSRQAIVKYIIDNFKVQDKVALLQVRLALKRLLADGKILAVTKGSFKRVPQPASAKVKKTAANKKALATKKVAANKKAVVGKSSKKIVKKSAVKKPVVRSKSSSTTTKKAAPKRKRTTTTATKAPAAKKARTTANSNKGKVTSSLKRTPVKANPKKVAASPRKSSPKKVAQASAKTAEVSSK